jgi:hypothetical protein
MDRLILFSWRAAALSTLAVGVAFPAVAQSPVRVLFGCDTPAGHVCYFTMISEGGKRRQTFSIEGGAKEQIGGVIPGADIYMVAIDRAPPSYPEQCGRQFPCKAAVVNPKYNN